MKPALFLRMTVVLSLCTLRVFSADLVINGETNRVYENGKYGKLLMTNSKGITIRNCRFSAPSLTQRLQTVNSIGDCEDIVVDGCDFDGKAEKYACDGLRIRGSKITIRNTVIHDFADDGIVIGTGSDMFLIDNMIHRLYGCGTDGNPSCLDPAGCNNGHSDGIEIAGTVTNLVLRTCTIPGASACCTWKVPAIGGRNRSSCEAPPPILKQ